MYYVLDLSRLVVLSEEQKMSRMIAVCLVCMGFGSTALAQPYFSGPFGPNGTYNLYEFVGENVAFGFPLSDRLPRYEFEEQARGFVYADAVEQARTSIETFTGQSVAGHLVTIGSPEENEFVTSFGTGYIGLTSNEVFLDEASVAAPGEDGRFWITGEPRTFTPVDVDFEDGVDGVQINARGEWFERRAGTQAENYIIEYETQLTGPVPGIIGEAAPVPGAPDDLPMFRVREVTNNGPVVNLAGAYASLRNLSPTANVLDYSIDTINFSDRNRTRRFDNDEYFRSNFPETPVQSDFDGDVSDLALVARTTFEITEELAGKWDFLVGADDAFELLIPGAEFYAEGRLNSRDRVDEDELVLVTPWGSLSQWRDRSFGEYQASIDLEAGHYDLELIFNENGGDAELELSARGPGQDDFHLVGSPTGLRLVPAAECLSGIGDLNGSGNVSFADFLILRSNFGSPGGSSDGDLDCDGEVAFADFLVLAENFGQTVGAAATVPEPNGPTPLLIAAFFLVGFRSRRT